MTIVSRPNITNITKYHQISPAATQKPRSENKTFGNQLFGWWYLVIFGNWGQYHTISLDLPSPLSSTVVRTLIAGEFTPSSPSPTSYHPIVLPIFCLTVVTLYPPESTRDLSSPIVTFYPLKSHIHTSVIRRRLTIFTITSVANHQNVLPICFLTLVSLCIFLNVRHCPLPTVTFKFLLSQIPPSMFARRLESASP